MEQRDGRTGRPAPRVQPAVRTRKERGAGTDPGVGKPAQQPDTGRGAIDHHQSNHGRRGR